MIHKDIFAGDGDFIHGRLVFAIPLSFTCCQKGESRKSRGRERVKNGR